jgi:hypothetical protein
MEFQEYDDMMRRMLAIVVRMEDVIDEVRVAIGELRVAIGELRDFNREQVAINARLETLLTRVLRSDDTNGRNA